MMATVFHGRDDIRVEEVERPRAAVKCAETKLLDGAQGGKLILMTGVLKGSPKRVQGAYWQQRHA